MKKYEEGKDYELVLVGENDSGVALHIEPFAGVIFTYGEVKFVEEEDSGILQFNYDVIQSGSYDMETLQNNQELITIAGDILQNLLWKMIDDKNRTTNPEEPDLQ